MQSEPRRQKAVTIADVARSVGVATSTVSRALSHPGRVSVETAKRVRAAADELGYRQEMIRPPGRRGERKVIVVMIFDLTHPFYFDVMRGIKDEARSASYEVMLIDAHSDQYAEREYVDRVLDFVDGIILVSPRMSDASVAHLAKQRATVVVNRHVREVASINQDTKDGMRQAVEHLADLGHDSVTYVPGPEASRIDGVRRHAIEEACRARGLAFRRVAATDASLLGGGRAAEEWLNHRTSGVIAFNDNTAVGFLHALKHHGLIVPDDVSIIGIDNLVLSVVNRPRLTTVAFAGYAQGVNAMRLILQPPAGAVPAHAVASVPMKLIIRETTGPAPQTS